jgi:hypothetical protein
MLLQQNKLVLSNHNMTKYLSSEVYAGCSSGRFQAGKRLQMSTESMDTQGRMQKKPETKSTEQLISAINFIKMQAGMYPEGHSMASQGLVNVSNVLREIFSLKEQITIRVEDDALYVGKDPLDKNNRGNRQFARWLNDLYITSITLSRGLTRDELVKFQQILVMKPPDLLALGNIEKVFSDRRMAHIGVKGLNLGHFNISSQNAGGRERSPGERPKATWLDLDHFSDAGEGTIDRERLKYNIPKVKDPDTGHFSTAVDKSTEGEESEKNKQLEDDIWQKFTSDLMIQSADPGEQISKFPDFSDVNSHDFVKCLNDETIDWDIFLNDYRSMIIQYLRSASEEEKSTFKNTILRIDSLVKDFHPHLKQKILHITEKELSSLPSSIIKSNKINCFNFETIAAILRGASDERREISPSLSLLFQRLSANLEESTAGSGKAELNGSFPMGETFTSAKEIEKLIEREEYEAYVPADYAEILKRKSMTAGVDEQLDKKQFIVGEYIHTLEDTRLNLQINKLLMALIDETVGEDEYQEISNFIAQNIPELILSGYFSFLIDVLNTYRRHSQDKPSEKIRGFADSGIKVFHDAELLSQGLKRLFLHGISLDSAVQFVVACGAQHVPWLLDLYPKTWSPKGQAMIVEVLRHFREEVISKVLIKLSEPSQSARKWLVLLQLIGNADIIHHVRKFADHPDITIRLEAIRTLLRFKDADAEALLRKSVFSEDRAESIQAIALACEYRIADICAKLVSQIRTSVILKKHLAFYESVITEVVRTRDSNILKNLEKLAGTRWSLFPRRLSRLKMALLNAIEIHTPPDAEKIIKNCFRSRNRQIRTSCMQLMRRKGK